MSLWISHHMAPLHTWPLITQWSSLITFPWLLGKAGLLHRLTLSHSVDQSKSHGQPRFTRWGIRHHILMGAVAGRHRNGGKHWYSPLETSVVSPLTVTQASSPVAPLWGVWWPGCASGLIRHPPLYLCPLLSGFAVHSDLSLTLGSGM